MKTQKEDLVERLFLTKNGEFVVGQAPNRPIIVWFSAFAVEHFAKRGPLKDAAGVIAFSSLLNWSLLELFTGVNLFRKILGFSVLVGMVASKAKRNS